MAARAARSSAPASPTTASCGSECATTRCRRKNAFPKRKRMSCAPGSRPASAGAPTPSTPSASPPTGGPATTGGPCGRCGGRRPPRSAMPAACAIPSMPSSSPACKRRGCISPPRRIGGRSLAGSSSISSACRRRPRTSRPSCAIPIRWLTRSWWIACWRRRITASAGPATGWTWCATARATASSATRRGPTPGITATGCCGR